MDETIETITPSSNHTLSQLELDHPGHPTRDDYCHNQVIDRLIDFEREDYQVTGLGIEQEGYQVNPLPPLFQDSIDFLSQQSIYQLDDNANQGLAESSGEGTTQMLSRSSSSESPKQMSLSSLSSDIPIMWESPKQMSLSSFSSEIPTMWESPKQMSLSSFWESPKQMSLSSFSSESPTIWESPKQMSRSSFSSETPTMWESPKQMFLSSLSSEIPIMYESPKQMSLSSFSSESPTYVCESPKPMSYSSEVRTLVYKSYKSSKRMSWSEHSKSRKSSSGIKTNRCSWDDETDMCLLLYLEQNKGKIEKLDNPHSGVKVELWEGASRWMLAHGYNYSADQCYNRWKNNKRHYTNGILNEKKKPAQYKSVGRILGRM
ncbi:unnamed protein product [Rhizophagus irregularis]|uniref:Myb/SANT-like DNA-binding domain-containing protein n=1 Tax=Rhizophagus irregularis TaxID=588596 RepID=A0A915ZND8_9GLOM|nr:unnamed protein product [Rhizophagus irregularis]